jgi:hypothetical protein
MRPKARKRTTLPMNVGGTQAHLLPTKPEEAFRVVGAQQVVVEGDGVHRPRLHEQDRNLPGVDHRVAGELFHPGMDPGVLLDEQPVTEQAPLLEQVIDNIPGLFVAADRRRTAAQITLGHGPFSWAPADADL